NSRKPKIVGIRAPSARALILTRLAFVSGSLNTYSASVRSFGLEGRRDILGAPDFQYGRLKTESGGRRLYLAGLLLIAKVTDVDHNRQAAETGDHLTQEIEALAGNLFGRLDREAGNIAAGSRQTCSDTG